MIARKQGDVSDLSGFYTLENAQSLAESVRSRGMVIGASSVRAIISAASAEIDKRDHQIEHLSAIIKQFIPTSAVAIAAAHDEEQIHPVMDDYRLTCCDCGLAHAMDFRALKVTEEFADGTWTYKALDPAKYRLMFRARRL